MSIGYACLTIGVPNTDQKSCRQNHASEEKLAELIAYNLNALENIIDYNIENNILLFRISSDIIPFGSSPVNTLAWWDIFAPQFRRIGEKIRSSGMRVSMHPGQYTVLNSPNEEVVTRAIADLKYHAKVLDSLGVGPACKIVLHIGGIYHEKEQAIHRFIAAYHRLDDAVKRRLVLENDDKSYTIKDVLMIGRLLHAPVIFDNLHHAIHHSGEQEDDLYWINECKSTWSETDGNQKVHYSQQDTAKQAGSHAQSIRIDEFMSYYNSVQREDLDIMLEVKDKNLSAVKCINCTAKGKRIKSLELEWSKYKYNILESAPANYLEIRKLLKNKNDYPSIPFYHLIEDALQQECTIGNSVNAAQHVWGYFKESATEKEKNQFLKSIEKFEQGKTSIRAIKNILWKMTVQYQQLYLMNSYYFTL